MTSSGSLRSLRWIVSLTDERTGLRAIIGMVVLLIGITLTGDTLAGSLERSLQEVYHLWGGV